MCLRPVGASKHTENSSAHTLGSRSKLEPRGRSPTHSLADMSQRPIPDQEFGPRAPVREKSGLGPYLGATILLGMISLVAAFLSRRGLNLKRLKFRDAEIEFAKEETPAVRISPEASARAENRLSSNMINLAPQAREDCRILDIPEYRVVDFLVSESASHSQSVLFSVCFHTPNLWVESVRTFLGW